ncbi:hypothetical protein CEN39_00575 [Fischerella thermalis CCMEE 5201]|jgi:hypothetical protein|nr:hypothetical protein CEN39_00575 [Fischerella thermalis CCMEE 5201]
MLVETTGSRPECVYVPQTLGNATYYNGEDPRNAVAPQLTQFKVFGSNTKRIDSYLSIWNKGDRKWKMFLF